MHHASIAHEVDVAWTRACDGLSLERGTPLATDEASVLLKYLVAEGAAEPGAPPCSAPHRARTALHRWIDGGLRALHRPLAAADRRTLTCTLREDSRYAERIVELAVADLVSEPMAPEVCIHLEPWPALPADGSCWNHGVVFSAASLVTHEIYPLAVDARVRDAHGSGPFFRVVGVHGDWLHGGLAHRVLVLDRDNDRFLEADLELPVALDSAHLLALGERQSDRHRCWTADLVCPIVNPWPAAAAADDKDSVRRRWLAAGLEVPRGELLEVGAHRRALRWLAEEGQIVVKPNCGVEGQRVRYLRCDDPDAVDHLETHLAACWEWGPVLIEMRRDAVCWRSPDTGALHSLALRLHVARHGDQVGAESGYAQVGADIDLPACRCDGGALQPLAGVVESLARRCDGAPVRFDAEDLERVRATAEAAVRVHAPLGLSGIDVVLDIDKDGRVLPVLLELNPRPAGLAHARFLPGCGEGRGEAGVSLSMWDGLADATESMMTPMSDLAEG